MYNHGLVPQYAYLKAVDVCKWNKFLTDCSGDYQDPSPACQQATQEAIAYIPNNIGIFLILNFLIRCFISRSL